MIPTRDQLSSVECYDDFVALYLSVGKVSSSELFNFLFKTAISSRIHPADKSPSFAAALLVELEPKHTRPCEELLDEIARSGWNVSCTGVPFYLITQFGKWSLIDSYNSYVSRASLNEEQHRRVQTIRYWTAGSSASLIRSHHDWPWRESEEED